MGIFLATAIVSSAAASQFTLNWTDNSNNETGFKVERSTDGTSYTQIATVGANTTSYIDSTVTPATTYWYRVRSYNSYGDSSYSNVSNGVASDTAPTISGLLDTTVASGSATGPLAFNVDDIDTGATGLTVSGVSSNTTLVPNAGIVFGGSGSSRSVTVTPAPNESGTATITVTVSDGILSSSQSFVLTVTAPVVVNQAPTIGAIADQTISEGGTTGAITFTVGDPDTALSSLVLSGTSANTTLVPNADIVFGGSGSSRTVTVTPAANQSGTATITVKVTDGVSTATTSFVLTVNAAQALDLAPNISSIPDQTVAAGTSTGAASFTIGDPDSTIGSLTLSAASSNTALIQTSNIVFGGSGTSRTVSVTPSSTQTGSAVVTITVSDGILTAASSFTVTVNAPPAPTTTAPAITSQPANETATVGDSVTFSVTASGDPSPTFQWMMNGGPIAGATSSSLVIANVQASDAGTYSVVASNSAGSVTSNNAVLTVQEPLAITQQPQSQTAAKHSVVNLSVTATGSSLTYQWYEGASGDTSAPVSGATTSAFTTPILTSSTSFWVRVSDGVNSIDSNTADITVVSGPRTFFGNINGNGNTSGADQIPVQDGTPVAMASTTGTTSGSGTFGLVVNDDGTAVMMGAVDSSTSWIDGENFTVTPTGSFTFDAPGLGQVSGQISGDTVTGSISSTGLTFSGTINSSTGSSASYEGVYDGVVANTSDGQALIIAGGSGHAYVLAGGSGTFSGEVVNIASDGSMDATLPDGQTINLTFNPSSGEVTGTTVSNGNTFPVQGLRSDVKPSKRIVNMSCRAHVSQGDSVMIAGFVVNGTGTKNVLIRAIGPSLASYNVPNVLSNPVLTVYRQNGTTSPTSIAQNDNWSDSADATQIVSTSQKVGAFAIPTGSDDSAVLANLPTGAYSAVVSGVNGETGAAMIEVYDVDVATGGTPTANLCNISMRSEVGTGNDVAIAGFVVNGNTPKRVLIRAVGPELTQYQVSGVLANPVVTLYQGSTQIDSNDDWGSGSNASLVNTVSQEVGAFPLDAGSKSAALVVWLKPGVYTAHASSADGTTGVALLEVYEAP